MRKKEKERTLKETEKQWLSDQRQLKTLIESMLSMRGRFSEYIKSDVVLKNIGVELELNKYYLIKFKNQIKQNKQTAFKLIRKSRDGCEILKEYPAVKGYAELKKKAELHQWPLQIDIREVPDNYAVTLAL